MLNSISLFKNCIRCRYLVTIEATNYMHNASVRKKVEPKRCMKGAVLENGSSFQRGAIFLYKRVKNGASKAPRCKEGPFSTFFF